MSLEVKPDQETRPSPGAHERDRSGEGEAAEYGRVECGCGQDAGLLRSKREPGSIEGFYFLLRVGYVLVRRPREGLDSSGGFSHGRRAAIRSSWPPFPGPVRMSLCPAIEARRQAYAV
jgi:hypothetical protein